MSEQSEPTLQPIENWRLRLGVVIFLVSILLPVAGIPLVTALDLSIAITSTISGVLLVGAEVVGILAIAVMGKPGYLYIKSRMFGFLKLYGPSQEVSQYRYYIGLIMFCMPLLFGWLSIYVADYIPGFIDNPLYYAVGGDLLLLTGLFMLGGEFWDKIRSLFIYNAKADFSRKNK